MTEIQIELPDATARAAQDAGMLTSHALDRLLIDAIKRRQAADSLLAVADSNRLSTREKIDRGP